MNYQEAHDFINNWKFEDNHNFIITNAEGKKEKRRLFTNNGYVCELKKGCRRYGYIVNKSEVESWQNIAVRDALIDAWKNLQKVNKLLEKSGLWTELATSLKKLETLGYVNFQDYAKLDWDGRRKWEQENNCPINMDNLTNSLKRGIKNVNWESQHAKELMLQAMTNKTKWSSRWTKGYDNTAEYNPECNRAWYSEEYRGCGNGHYYLMIDYTHALFGEDD